MTIRIDQMTVGRAVDSGSRRGASETLMSRLTWKAFPDPGAVPECPDVANGPRITLGVAFLRPPTYEDVRRHLLSHAVSHAVPSALKGLASGFGMEPGVSLSLWPP